MMEVRAVIRDFGHRLTYIDGRKGHAL